MSRSSEAEEIVSNLKQAGFPANDIMVEDGSVYVGRDTQVSLVASREMIQPGASSEEQYRTANTISRSLTTICVNGDALSGVYVTALGLAIQKYNQLPLSFKLARTPAFDCSFTINALIEPGGGTTSWSGFPAGGLPFSTIVLGDGLSTLDVHTIQHVVMHELGHTIGLRHSDFYNQAISCGGPAFNEENPPTGIGAILVPGTPSTATVGGSVMNSCFRATESGEFSASDVTALIMLYGPPCNDAVWAGASAMAALDEWLYVAQDSRLHRVSPSDGSWADIGPAVWAGVSAMTALDGWLYVAQDSRLHRVNPSDGSWTDIGPAVWAGASAMTALGGMLYVAQDSRLHRVNPSDGSWTDIGPAVWAGASAMTALGGMLYVAQDSRLHRVSPSDGSWTDIGPAVWAGASAMTALDGWLYVAQDSRLHRVNSVDGSWGILSPCFGPL